MNHCCYRKRLAWYGSEVLLTRKRRKARFRKNVSLKDVLRLLVNKLDEITETIANANGPRYFLLYMTHANKPTVGSFATLKEVWQRLAK